MEGSGFVAVYDLLGFKGIQSSDNTGVVAKKVQRCFRTAVKEVVNWFKPDNTFTDWDAKLRQMLEQIGIGPVDRDHVYIYLRQEPNASPDLSEWDRHKREIARMCFVGVCR